MKIGILTFHDGINHGAFLQAYCLQETLKKICDNNAQVKIINYKSRSHYLKENKHFIGDFKEYLRRSTLKKRIPNIYKIFKFKRNQKLFNLTKFSHEVSVITNQEKFDLVVLGSDEIWNFKHPMIGLDLTYFGKSIQAKKIVSYAPSFGQVTSKDDEISLEVISCLQKLDGLSVRDNNSLAILKKFSLTAIKVLDPTFLYDVQLPVFKQNLHDYILIYLAHVDHQDISTIKKYAKSKNKKLIAIGYQKKWCDQNFISVDVFEWLNFFKNADQIITNTFHGSIYSILYNQTFCVLNPGKKSNKINSLLADFNLKHLTIEKAECLSDILTKQIDYEDVNNKIKQYKEESLEYLYKSTKLELTNIRSAI